MIFSIFVAFIFVVSGYVYWATSENKHFSSSLTKTKRIVLIIVSATVGMICTLHFYQVLNNI